MSDFFDLLGRKKSKPSKSTSTRQPEARKTTITILELSFYLYTCIDTHVEAKGAIDVSSSWRSTRPPGGRSSFDSATPKVPPPRNIDSLPAEKKLDLMFNQMLVSMVTSGVGGCVSIYMRTVH